MSGVGSMGTVPSSALAAKPPGNHPVAGFRPMLAVLTLIVAIALVLTSAPGLIAAFDSSPRV